MFYSKCGEGLLFKKKNQFVYSPPNPWSYTECYKQKNQASLSDSL